MDWTAVVSLGFIVYVGYSAFIGQQKKERQAKAFKLTKAIGNKDIRCVSVKFISCDKPGISFYLVEEKGSPKLCYKIAEGWDQSNGQVNPARKEAKKLMSLIPYKAYWIEELDISEYEFFKSEEYQEVYWDRI